jgi:hypothetical protein
MNILVVFIIGGGDFGEKAGDHLDDISDGHRADLIFARLETMTGEM